MTVSKEYGVDSEGKLEKPILIFCILKFWDIAKVGGIQNENFPLVIIEIIKIFDMPKIFINGGSSCDIMYVELIEKLGLKREKMWLYEGSDL